MKMKAIACAVAAVATIVTLSLVIPAEGAVSNRIVLGRSIGPIKLGMTRARVHEVYRHKHSGHLISGPRTFVESYNRGEITVVYCCGKKLSAKAFSIATISPEWITPEGIGVGSSELQLAGTYPVTCVNDTPGPTGLLVACYLKQDSRVTTFHMNETVPDTLPSLIPVEGVQVYIGVPPGV